MIMQCETCGRPTDQQILCLDGDVWHILCPNCASQLNSCSFCKKVNTCLFETDPSPLPKMIQKQIRQGPMISVTTEKNPERIRQTCEKGCDCFDPNFDCLRQFHYCERIDHVYDESKAVTASNSDEVHSEIYE